MKDKISAFFYRYWWLYYLLIFLLIGLLIYLLKQDSKYNNTFNNINRIAESYDECLNNSTNDSTIIIENNGSFGCLSMTLVWNTIDDLDLHVIDPFKEHIFFRYCCARTDGLYSKSKGQLDIDMNADELKVETPLENIHYECYPPNGEYNVFVQLFGKTVSTPINYTLIIREKGKIKKKLNGSISISKKINHIISYQYSHYE
jgi:hypothetical protein